MVDYRKYLSEDSQGTRALAALLCGHDPRKLVTRKGKKIKNKFAVASDPDVDRMHDRIVAATIGTRKVRFYGFKGGVQAECEGLLRHAIAKKWPLPDGAVAAYRKIYEQATPKQAEERQRLRVELQWLEIIRVARDLLEGELRGACCNGAGKPEAAKIYRVMKQEAQQYWEGPIPLSERRTCDVLSKWLKVESWFDQMWAGHHTDLS